jgi:HEAT repeat protein
MNMDELTLDILLQQIASDDPHQRTEAWQNAGTVGAPALKPLAELAEHEDLEVRRAAVRAMWRIVRSAGAPDADEIKPAVNQALLALLADGTSVGVSREVLWMLSELACGECAVETVAELLDSQELREDARCCLQRIPGDESLAALQSALNTVPKDFQLAIAQSLRARGVAVSETKYPCQKLVPSRQTSVKPVGR